MVTSIIKLFIALNSNGKAVHIALGIGWGLVLALVPSSNLLWVVLFGAMFFLRINQGAAILVTMIGKIFTPFVDPVIDKLGLFVLQMEALQPPLTTLYNTPIIPFTNFNHSLVTGGFLIGVLLFLPVTLLFKTLIEFYRNSIREKFRNSKIVKSLKAIPIVGKLIKQYSRVSRYYKVLR